MLSRIYQLFHINTVTKRIAVITVAFGILIFILINAVLPNVVYAVLKSYVLQPVTLMVQDASSRLSSLLMGNSHTIGTIYDDPDLDELLSIYYKETENRDEIRRIIQEEKLFYMSRGRGSSDDSKKQTYINTAIITTQGDIFYDESMEWDLEPLVSSDWYKNYRHAAENGSRLYSPVFLSPDGTEYICYVNTKPIDNELFHYVLIEDITFLMSSFQSLDASGVEDILLLGVNNEILYSMSKETGFSTDSFADGIDPQHQVFTCEKRGSVDFIARSSSEDEGLKIAVNAPESVLLKPFSPLILFVELLLGFSLLFFIVLTCLSVKQSLRNLKVLSRHMLKIQDGDYTVRANIRSVDELAAMGNIFNIMIEKIIEHEKHEKDMQYTILISEIDPHFIYNTLNTITYLSRLGRTDDIISVNKALISMLKDRLKLKNYESFDIFSNEAEVINQYLVIQNYLYGGKINLVWDVSESLMTRRIPKNILQPLVENAIIHGLLANKDEKGKVLPGEIIVSMEECGQGLKLTVRDNGRGMDTRQVNKYFNASDEVVTVAGENIGIKNIIMRLKYLFGDNGKINAISEVNHGTTIEVIFPSNGNNQ